MDRDAAIGLILILCTGGGFVWLSIVVLAHHHKTTPPEYLIRLVAGSRESRRNVTWWKRFLVGFGRLWAAFLTLAGVLLLIGTVAPIATVPASQLAAATLDGVGPFSASLVILSSARLVWRALDFWVERSAPNGDDRN